MWDRINPSHAEATFICSTLGHKDFSKTCRVGTHWIALAEFFRMSTQMPEF